MGRTDGRGWSMLMAFDEPLMVIAGLGTTALIRASIR